MPADQTTQFAAVAHATRESLLRSAPGAVVANVRNDMYLASEAIRFLAKSDQVKLDAQTRDHLASFKTLIDAATMFIPVWIKVAVAIALEEEDGRVYAVVVFILIAVMAWIVLNWLNGGLTVGNDSYASNKTLSIGVGGAFGIVMMLNVWGIIWPNNKRSIAAFAGTGPAAPPELARQAFLASRTNAWLSLPLLLLMATAHGDWVIFGK